MADKIIKFGVQKIAGGIGLASEAITAHKEKKHAGSPAHGPNSNNNASKPHTPPPLDQMRSYSDPSLHEMSDPSVLQEDEEEQWALDEAQVSLVQRENPPPYSEDNQQENSPPPNKVPQLIAAFILHYPAPPNLPPQLQFPVLLPQRRPKDKTRGFIRAYAPLLMDSGIDQTTFFEFLDLFDRASAASPWLNAINLASLAFSFLPMGISMAISVAIGIAVKASMELQSRARTTTFLDKINDGFFRPRGLYCLIMTWNPEASSAITSVNLTSTITSNITPPTSIPQNLSHKFRGSDANASPDMSFPATAPLIFPALEDLASSTSTESGTIREKMKQKGKFIAEYWDKRARAEYAAKNPDSVLVQGPKAEFTSRYADPTHPASSGNLVSLVTGGHINPPSLRELRGGAAGVGERGIGMDGGFGGRGMGFGMGGGPWGGRQMGYGGRYDGYDMMGGGYGYGPAYGGRFGGGPLGGGFGGGLGYGRMGGGFGGGFGGGLGGGPMGMGRGFGGLVGLVSGIENMAMGGGRTPLDARMQMNQEAQYEYGYGRGQMGPGYYPGGQEYEYGREPYYPQNVEHATREPDMSRGLSDTPGMQGGPGLARGIGGGFGGLGGAGGVQNIIPIKKVLKKHVLYMMIVNMPSEEEMAAASEQFQAAEAEQARQQG